MTTEDRVKLLIGDQAVTIAALTVELEKARERISELEKNGKAATTESALA